MRKNNTARRMRTVGENYGGARAKPEFKKNGGESQATIITSSKFVSRENMKSMKYQSDKDRYRLARAKPGSSPTQMEWLKMKILRINGVMSRVKT